MTKELIRNPLSYHCCALCIASPIPPRPLVGPLWIELEEYSKFHSCDLANAPIAFLHERDLNTIWGCRGNDFERPSRLASWMTRLRTNDREWNLKWKTRNLTWTAPVVMKGSFGKGETPRKDLVDCSGHRARASLVELWTTFTSPRATRNVCGGKTIGACLLFLDIFLRMPEWRGMPFDAEPIGIGEMAYQVCQCRLFRRTRSNVGRSCPRSILLTFFGSACRVIHGRPTRWDNLVGVSRNFKYVWPTVNLASLWGRRHGERSRGGVLCRKEGIENSEWTKQFGMMLGHIPPNLKCWNSGGID